MHTNTEDFNASINYYSSCKENGNLTDEAKKSYESALKSAINIFSKQIENNYMTQKDAEEFYEVLTCAGYLDNPINIVEVTNYFNEVVVSALDKSKEMNTKMIA